MKERPIPFNAEMVRAVLDGRKTQTRRVVKSQPENNTDCPYHVGVGAERKARICPYGKPGDRLWVRETWAAHWMFDDVPPRSIPAFIDGTRPECLYYRADDPLPDQPPHEGRIGKWRPSIHMPRWASRILLEVTNVRVERVQEISDADIVAEGVTPVTTSPAITHYRPEFWSLWNSVYGSDAWDRNDWVWVVEFRRVCDE